MADAGPGRARRARLPVAQPFPRRDRVRPAGPRRVPRGPGGAGREPVIDAEDPGSLREQLRALLSEDAQNGERLIERLEILSEETGLGEHAALLLVLTHLRMEDEEARKVWDEVLVHRHEMSVAL